MRETSQALAAFADYREMVPPRSLRALAERYRTADKPPTRRFKTLGDWSVAHDWQARCRRHDEEIAAAAAEANKAQRLREMEERRQERLRVAKRFRQKVDAALDILPPEFLIEKPSAMVQMEKHASDTERLEYGEATEHHAISGSIDVKTISDLDGLSDEELHALVSRHRSRSGSDSGAADAGSPAS
jgi:hypothetical protein